MRKVKKLLTFLCALSSILIFSACGEVEEEELESREAAGADKTESEDVQSCLDSSANRIYSGTRGQSCTSADSDPASSQGSKRCRFDSKIIAARSTAPWHNQSIVPTLFYANCVETIQKTVNPIGCFVQSTRTILHNCSYLHYDDEDSCCQAYVD
jgi:hypothetical protein